MENEIIQLLRNQDDQGLDLFMERYSGLIYYILGGILQDLEEIEECINDIYMKIWKSIDSYSIEKGKFTSWITVISRNTALNYLKKKQNQHEEIRDEFTSQYSTEDIVLKYERSDEIKEAISSLAPDEQHIFYRKYYYLQKTNQIAAELGLTERSVEGRLYRIRKKLQKKLGGDFS